jgi:hypothetical protein
MRQSLAISQTGLRESIERLRQRGALPELVTIANVWRKRFSVDDRFPQTLDEFLERCVVAGRSKPTPLLLRYEAGGYNCLHQDHYREMAIPVQIGVLLSRSGAD